MPKLHLYRTDTVKTEKVRVYIGMVEVDQPTYDDVKRNYRTDWCSQNGYDETHYLRVAKVIETTEAERRDFSRAHDRLKAEGKLPSAFETISAKIGNKRG